MAGAAELPDGRGWELVSPVEKNGGQIEPAGALAGGGALQAAAGGGAVTYGSGSSFGPGAGGAPPASQYFSQRGSGGWSTANITAPIFSGSYGLGDEGVLYRLFSGDLARGLLLNGRHCRDGGTGCAVANPPLPGSGAPAGFQNYYLRDNSSGAYEALLSAGAAASAALDPASFDLVLAGASPDLRHVVLSTCAALTADATEVPLGAGCDPAATNLYEWSGGTLSLVNLLPGQSLGTPGAALAASAGAVSSDGARVYWTDGADLYLRARGETRQVDADVGGGGTFQTAGDNGAVALYTKAGHLYRYDAGADASTDLTPGGGVVGVLGASADGSHVYYLTGAGLFLHDGVAPAPVAGAADAGNYPPSTGTARVSANGAQLAFVSSANIAGYDNADPVTGTPHSEVYVYDAGSGLLACASCRPNKTRPTGPATIPGATANGTGPTATRAYKPRALSADGRRLFFDSRDALIAGDTNKDWDVYEWQAQGAGGCGKVVGCVALLSSGISEDGASFVDASSDGSDVFFLTDGPLVAGDPGSVDLYDARVGGGFPLPKERTPCEGDACQAVPNEAVDPPLSTSVPGRGNPAIEYAKVRRHCKKSQIRRRGKCVKRPRHRSGPRQGRAR